MHKTTKESHLKLHRCAFSVFVEVKKTNVCILLSFLHLHFLSLFLSSRGKIWVAARKSSENKSSIESRASCQTPNSSNIRLMMMEEGSEAPAPPSAAQTAVFPVFPSAVSGLYLNPRDDRLRFRSKETQMMKKQTLLL